MERHSWEFRNYSITISIVQSWELCFRFYNLKTMRNHQILFSEILVWTEFTGKSKAKSFGSHNSKTAFQNLCLYYFLLFWALEFRSGVSEAQESMEYRGQESLNLSNM